MAGRNTYPVMEYLRQAATRGGDTWRSTKEVAAYCGCSVSTARRRLYALNRNGLVDVAGGNPIAWRVK